MANTTAENLNDVMQFEHVIQVHEDGTVIDRPDLCAPNLHDEELDNPDWRFFSAGYTRQDHYCGPIMHNSEFIGGALARDILDEPGIYAAVVAYWSPEDGDEDDESDVEGWAIVKLDRD